MMEEKLRTDSVCCEVFGLTVDVWKWFSFADNPRILAIPCIVSQKADYKVNFCPACGAEIRGKIYDKGDLTAHTGEE